MQHETDIRVVGEANAYEEQRLRYRRIIRIAAIWFFLLPAMGIPAMAHFQDDRPIFFGILILLIMNFFGFLIIYFEVYRRYERLFRNQIAVVVFPTVFPGQQYDPSPAPPDEEVRKSLLFWNTPLGRLECVESYAGDIQRLPYRITRMRGRRRSSGGPRGEVYFDGVFLRLDSGLDRQPLIIAPRLTGMLAAAAGLLSQKPSLPPVTLGLVNLEEGFTVHSENCDDTRTFLSEQRIRAWLDFESEQTHRYQCALSFVDGTLYITVNNFLDGIDINLKRSLAEPQDLNGIFLTFVRLRKLLTDLM